MVIWLLWLWGCDDDPCPRGSMLDSVAGLVVTEAEHPTGFGQPDCAGCHALEAMHRADCTPGVDLAAVRDEVRSTGYDGCVDCHGDNGVDE